MKKISLFLIIFLMNILYAYNIRLNYNDYQLDKQKNYDVINLPNTYFVDNPGEPLLPVQNVKIILPYGYNYQNVKIGSSKQLLNGNYDILPTPENIPNNLNLKNTVNKKPTYTKNEFYPKKIYEIKGIQYKNGVAILFLNIYPLQYNPITGKVMLHNKINISMDFIPDEEMKDYEAKMILKPNFIRKHFDTKKYKNSDALATYYNKADNTYSPLSSLVSESSPYDYIIITNSSLEPYWNDFISHKQSMGLNVALFTTEDIYANYSGNDNPDKIRNFIIDAYSTWAGTDHPLQWVILGGDGNIVPARAVKVYAYWSSTWNNRTFYTDNYYAGLDGDWDNDADGTYGEGDDSLKPDDLTATLGTNGEEADFLFEISVGRASLEDSTEINNWVNKTVAYENLNVSTDYLKTSTLVGEYLGNNTWGKDYMNELALYMPELNQNKLYQSDGNYSKQNVIDAINNGTHLISHIGHGNYLKVCNIYDGDVDTLLTNTDYCLFYTQACYSGNYYTLHCIAESFIEKPHGAFAFIGNSHYGFYSTYQQQGSSQLFQREFYDAIFNENITKIGDAIGDSKSDLIGIIGATGSIRFSAMDITLFGDPNLALFTNVGDVSAEQISTNTIKITYTDTPQSGYDDMNNYSICQRDDNSQNIAVNSLSSSGNYVYLYLDENLSEGIPYNVLISNVTGIKNPTERPIKSIYNIIELSINKPTVWSATQSPYYVYKDLVINGGKLTIEAGTTVKFNTDKYAIVYNNGWIKAQGDIDNKVIFTSYSDSTRAQSGDWDEILIYRDANSDSCIFDNCKIEYATVGVNFDSLTTATITNTNISHCSEKGINSYFAQPTISYTSAYDCGNGFYFENSQTSLSNIIAYQNANYGLYLTDNSDITLKNSIIYNNTSGDYYSDSSTINITYTDLQNLVTGIGNISIDPLFESIFGFSLSPFSPCIDAGNPSDFDSDGTVADMGINPYYQSDNLATPTIQSITVSDSVNIEWNNVNGAIFYNVYSSDNPYSGFTIRDSLIKAYSWQDTIFAEKKFYFIKAGNNR